METPREKTSLEKTSVEKRSPAATIDEQTVRDDVEASAGAPAPATAPGPVTDSKVAPSVGPPPDGGPQAWLVVTGTWFVFFIQFGLFNTFGTFQEYYQVTLLPTHSPDQISWIGSVQIFLLFFCGLIVGRTFDAYGSRWLLLVGSVLFSLSLFLTSLCTEFYQLMLAQGVLFGISGAMVFHPSIAVIGHYFAKHRGLAVGVAVSGSGIGGTVLPIMASRLFDSIGFPWTMRIFGFMAVGMLGLANVLIKARLPPRKPSPLIEGVHAFKERPYLLVAISTALFMFSFYPPSFYISAFASAIGLSSSLSFYMLTFFNAGTIIGRLVIGPLADRFGRFNAYIVSTTICVIFVFGTFLPASFYLPPASTGLTAGSGTVGDLGSSAARSLTITFSVIFGACAGAVVSLIPVCVAQISPPHQIGNRLGIMWGCSSFMGLISGPIAGALIQDYHGTAAPAFQGLIILTGVAVTLSVFIMIAARLTLNPKLLAVA